MLCYFMNYYLSANCKELAKYKKLSLSKNLYILQI